MFSKFAELSWVRWWISVEWKPKILRCVLTLYGFPLYWLWFSARAHLCLFLWQNFFALVSAVSEACYMDKLQQQADLYVCLPFPSSKMKVVLALIYKVYRIPVALTVRITGNYQGVCIYLNIWGSSCTNLHYKTYHPRLQDRKKINERYGKGKSPFGYVLLQVKNCPQT